jgi:hypothetical protein
MIKGDHINWNREIAEYHGGLNPNIYNYFEFNKFMELNTAAS